MFKKANMIRKKIRKINVNSWNNSLEKLLFQTLTDGYYDILKYYLLREKNTLEILTEKYILINQICVTRNYFFSFFFS